MEKLYRNDGEYAVRQLTKALLFFNEPHVVRLSEYPNYLDWNYKNGIDYSKPLKAFCEAICTATYKNLMSGKGSVEYMSETANSFDYCISRLREETPRLDENMGWAHVGEPTLISSSFYHAIKLLNASYNEARKNGSPYENAQKWVRWSIDDLILKYDRSCKMSCREYRSEIDDIFNQCFWQHAEQTLKT